MLKHGFTAIALAATLSLPLRFAAAQTPDQQKTWEVQSAQRAAAQQAEAERLARERAARKADPMAWVRTLDPMSAGGWEFRSVASDGSWAIYTTTHQMKRFGSDVTVWFRQEFAEQQVDSNGRYSSLVEKTEFDCKKERMRNLLIITYAGNNIQGAQQSEENDPKETPWNAIVPGSRDELSYLWACKQRR